VPSYSEERKQQILNKLLPPSNMTVAEVSRIEGIGLQTLYNWRDKAKQQGRPVPGSKPTSEHWSAEAKFATVLETASLNEAELSEYCRAKGLYVDQVKAWKADALRGFMSSREQELEAKRQRQADHKEIKQLKGELRRKEKALAETAALLVLRKKLNALWENDNEDD
jgi:transposase-like protein